MYELLQVKNKNKTFFKAFCEAKNFLNMYKTKCKIRPAAVFVNFYKKISQKKRIFVTRF